MTLRAGRAAIASLAVVLAIAGCGGGDDSEVTQTEPASLAPSIGDSTLMDVRVEPGNGTDDYVAAPGDAHLTTCAAADAGWAFSGTVTNSTEGVRAYRVYVSVVGADGATRAVVQNDVAEVAAGVTADWSGTAAVEGDDLHCLTRVERITP